MNCFHKNLKRLRTIELNISQEEFGSLFDLTHANIRSYENSTDPKLGKFIEMMNYFNLNPIRFTRLDMTKHNVFTNKSEEVLTQKSENDSNRFSFLSNMEKEEIKDAFVKQSHTVDKLEEEVSTLKDKLLTAYQQLASHLK